MGPVGTAAAAARAAAARVAAPLEGGGCQRCVRAASGATHLCLWLLDRGHVGELY